jgi:hypothetical protein
MGSSIDGHHLSAALQLLVFLHAKTEFVFYYSRAADAFYYSRAADIAVEGTLKNEIPSRAMKLNPKSMLCGLLCDMRCWFVLLRMQISLSSTADEFKTPRELNAAMDGVFFLIPHTQQHEDTCIRLTTRYVSSYCCMCPHPDGSDIYR